jgi:hypothetical protein
MSVLNRLSPADGKACVWGNDPAAAICSAVGVPLDRTCLEARTAVLRVDALAVLGRPARA